MFKRWSDDVIAVAAGVGDDPGRRERGFGAPTRSPSTSPAPSRWACAARAEPPIADRPACASPQDTRSRSSSLTRTSRRGSAAGIATDYCARAAPAKRRRMIGPGADRPYRRGRSRHHGRSGAGNPCRRSQADRAEL